MYLIETGFHIDIILPILAIAQLVERWKPHVANIYSCQDICKKILCKISEGIVMEFKLAK